MPGQLTIQFDVTHQRENNRESQQHLELNRESFNRQCWEVLMRMLGGEKITNKSGIESGIGDIRRRAKDLIDNFKIPVQREWIEEDGKKTRWKQYYIAEADRGMVAQRIINKTEVKN